MKGVLRDYYLINLLFPELLRFNIMKEDRELKQNSYLTRQFLHQIIKERRQGINKNSLEHAEDLLTILLRDDLYSNNDEAIIDECMTFIIASTQTTSLAISNLLNYITINQAIRTKLQKEIDSIIPTCKNILLDLTFESTDKFEYLIQCF